MPGYVELERRAQPMLSSRYVLIVALSLLLSVPTARIKSIPNVTETPRRLAVCRTWQSESMRVGLRDLEMLSATNGWAVGDHGIILH